MTFSLRNSPHIRTQNPLAHPASPSAAITSHILIQTERGRLSDASIRFNRILSYDENSFHSQRCSFRPLLYVTLVVLVAFSLLAIVMGEAAFPLVVEDGKVMNRRSGGNKTEGVRMGNRYGDALPDWGEERNGNAVVDEDDGALSYLAEEYNEGEEEILEVPVVEDGNNISMDDDEIDLVNKETGDTHDSVSIIQADILLNTTNAAEGLDPSESLDITRIDDSPTNATTAISMNATSNDTLESSYAQYAMSTTEMSTDESENQYKPLR